MDAGENMNLWLSCTGRKVDVKGSPGWERGKVDRCTINMTVIVFGTDRQTLEKITVNTLYACVQTAD